MGTANIKQLKTRIRSVNSTMHITKAMELVASSKMKRATDRLDACRPYSEAVQDVFSHLAGCVSPYTTVKPESKILVIAIAGDRGLAGGYNNEVFKRLNAVATEKDVQTLPIGKRMVDYCHHHNFPVYESIPSVEKVELSSCAKLGQKITQGFLAGDYDAVYVIYTRFISMLSHEIEMEQLLPLKIKEENHDEKKVDILFEPDQESVLNAAVPEYVSGRLYGFVSESFTSELSARRNAMDSATKNATAMIDDLSLKYNRARQGAITQEITEIIGGSESD